MSVPTVRVPIMKDGQRRVWFRAFWGDVDSRPEPQKVPRVSASGDQDLGWTQIPVMTTRADSLVIATRARRCVSGTKYVRCKCQHGGEGSIAGMVKFRIITLRIDCSTASLQPVPNCPLAGDRQCVPRQNLKEATAPVVRAALNGRSRNNGACSLRIYPKAGETVQQEEMNGRRLRADFSGGVRCCHRRLTMLPWR